MSELLLFGAGFLAFPIFLIIILYQKTIKQTFEYKEESTKTINDWINNE